MNKAIYTSLIALSIVIAPSLSAGEPYVTEGKKTGAYWPTKGWRTCSPEAAGMDSKALSKAIKYALTPEFNTEGIVVIKDGYIVGETYVGKFKKDTLHTSFSMAKSFTSALVGIAINEKRIDGVDVKLSKYYEGWDKEGDLRSQIKIRNALTLTSGLKWHEDWSKWDPKTNDALKMGASKHYVAYMAARQGLHKPGTFFTYSTGDPMLLSLVLKKATGLTPLEYGKKKLFAPLNFAKIHWEQDADGHTSTAWGIYARVRDYAKFGYLYLRKGKWEDKQLVPEKWVKTSTQTDASVKMWKGYGYLWHVNLPVRLNAPKGTIIPADGYMAEGVMGQHIFVIPSRNLVIVKVAQQKQKPMDVINFLTLVLKAVKP